MSPRAETTASGCPRCTLRRGGVAAALAVGLLVSGGGVALGVTTLPTSVPVTSSTASGESWAAELALDGGDDSGLALSDGGVRLAALGAPGRPAQGVLTLAPRRLAAPAAGLEGVLTADLPPGTSVDVQARGLGARGVWGDWLPVRAGTPAGFTAPTVDVQVRLLLHGSADGTASPVVREVWLTAVRPTPPPAPTTTTTSAKPTTTTTTTSAKPTTTTTTTTTTPPTTSTTTTTTTPPRPGPPKPPGPPVVPPVKPGPPPTTTTTTNTTTATPPPPPAPRAFALATTTTPPTTTTTPPTSTTAATMTTATTTPPTTTTAPTTSTTPSTPAVTALWDGAIASSGLAGFKDTPYNITGRSSVTVVDGPPKAIRFTVPSGSERAEIEPDVPEFREGQTRYFRLTYVLPTSFPTEPSGFQLASQWKNDGEGSPPLELRIEKGKFVLGGGYGRPGGSRLFATDIAPVVTGRPVELVVGITFSTDPAKGRVDVWVDGQQKVTGFRPPGGTLYPGTSSYWKVGLYRDAADAGTATADLTAAAMGTSYDAVG